MAKKQNTSMTATVQRDLEDRRNLAEALSNAEQLLETRGKEIADGATAPGIT